MTFRAYVGNIPFSFTPEDLTRLFSEFGSVRGAEIISDRATGRSRGFGFVELETAESLKAAIEGLDGKALGGRPLVVNEARERAPRAPGEGGGPGPRHAGGGGFSGARPGGNGGAGGGPRGPRPGNGSPGGSGAPRQAGFSGGGGPQRSSKPDWERKRRDDEGGGGPVRKRRDMEERPRGGRWQDGGDEGM